ncbi:MAG: hypothetical protein AAGC79_07070 [Pseudomonadota bacterium]
MDQGTLFEQTTFFEQASLVVQIVGFALVTVSLLLVYRQIQSRVFCEYTKRYSDIEFEFFDEFYDIRRAASLSEIEPEQRRRARLIVSKYISLFSEEYHLQTSWYLAKKTWTVWDTGIQEFCKVPVVREMVPDIAEGYQYFPEFRDYLLSVSDA